MTESKHLAKPITLLQGRYLEGSRNRKGEVKWMRLQTAEGERHIKLPKYIRYTVAHELQPGAMVRVWARSKDKGLKALQVIPLAPASEVAPLAGPASTASPSAEAPVTPSAPIVPAQQTTRRIQVCRKKNCCKRGGEAVWSALERAIADDPQTRLEAVGCLKQCKKGPSVRLMPERRIYTRVRPQDVAKWLATDQPDEAGN